MLAAFGSYACMYGFRKPFTAGAYADSGWGGGFKAWLVTAQVLGYTVSKFVGIRIIAEMKPERRAWMFLGLVGMAELALLLFAITPVPYNAAWLFFNGLALGMVFGLVLGFLEGRRLTEAFVAGLCASFILADGVTKSVGTLLLNHGIPERWMPFGAGLLFVLPLAGFVWMLRQIPAPSAADIAARSERSPMTHGDRLAVLRRHGVGLGLITLAYLLITVLRSIRADFAPEIWASLGTTGQPGVYTRSEIWVALGVVSINGLVCLVRDNRRAFFLALFLCMAGLGLVVLSLSALNAVKIAPFAFMVVFGLGMYVPYVAVHTTIFERFIALTRERANIGYLMYLADAMGYLGYVAVMLGKRVWRADGDFLGFFTATSWVVVIASLLAFGCAGWLFARKFPTTAPKSS